ncbi:MAG: hypothetical protein FWG13_00035 [Leptospirales bacterium]|nr:hypothetical protein [Leptospirales bacterium]
MKVKNSFIASFVTRVLLVAVVVIMGSCATGNHPAKTDNNAEPLSPTIRIERADNVPNKFDSIYQYNDNNGSERIIIWSDATLKNFDFISVGFGDSLFPENILYSIKELSPKKAFVVQTFVSGTIPSRGISFLDKNNKKRYFYISESGLDGSLLLGEFHNNNK